jgi:Fe-Mn family superoxide dismutase
MQHSRTDSKSTGIYSRRRFLASAAAAGCAAPALLWQQSSPADPVSTSTGLAADASPVALPPLPYPPDALEPVLSAETIGFHYGKHHRAYFDNLLKLTAGTSFADKSLEQLIVATQADAVHETIFNNAAQAWNHNFYWRSLSPSTTLPNAPLRAAVARDFGTMDGLCEKLAAAAAARFGSGWGWLVADRGKLSVISTSNADTPLTRGVTPLLTVDVWEHAYYLQYQNRRAEYLGQLIGKLLNWEFAAANFSRL